MAIPFFDSSESGYRHLQDIENRSFICGFCGHKVSSDRGYKIGQYQDGSGDQIGGVYICPNCNGPTFFSPDGEKFPGNAFGEGVDDVPDDLNTLYEEARKCTAENCHTAAVLLCRKILMNIAVDRGAEEDLRFIEYVNYLSDEGYTPPDGKHWVDHIRQKGNEANHEIHLMGESDAKDLLVFSGMLLKFNYEFPSMIPDPEGQ
jgi:hypothetical protein